MAQDVVQDERLTVLPSCSVGIVNRRHVDEVRGGRELSENIHQNLETVIVCRLQAMRPIDFEKITLRRAHCVPGRGRQATKVGRGEVQHKIDAAEVKFKGAGEVRKALHCAVVIV